ncbi:thioredoxin domain-containing protein [Candidatus Micrarchaeota archaeon]|nr:thioredoxin domain-containing protein [Candidatus Micrarchaeota archaeon]
MAYPQNSKIKWLAYCENSFQQAKLQLKPIFLLISVPWSKWGGLFEKETLEDETIAKNLNAHFICIFANGDKRADLVSKYATNGLPLTQIFDFKGNKLANFSGHVGKDSLMDLISNAASGKIPIEIEKAQVLETTVKHSLTKESISNFLQDFNSQIAYAYDELYAGFGKGQKAPLTHLLEYLLALHSQDGKALWRGIVEKTLKNMEQIADSQEGGFFRASSSRDWTAPQFEKMLDSNSQIASLYLKAYKVLGNDAFRAIGIRNLDWLLATLYDPKSGAFNGSQDSDEHYFQASSEKRKNLPRPYTDQTKYCNWNSQAAIALLHSHKITGNLKYFEIADRTLSFIAKNLLSKADGCFHYYSEKEGAKLSGNLNDNAWAAIAFLEAYRVGKQKEHLDLATQILNFMLSSLYSKEKGAFIERNSNSAEMYRDSELKSEKLPYQENAIAIWALLQAFNHTKEENYLSVSKETFANFQYVSEDLDSTALFGQIALNLPSYL